MYDIWKEITQQLGNKVTTNIFLEVTRINVDFNLKITTSLQMLVLLMGRLL